MADGTANKFKQFTGKSTLQEQNKGVGRVVVLKRSRYYIYYLITKPCCVDKLMYKSLRQALIMLCVHCRKNERSKIGVPRIECGLD